MNNAINDTNIGLPKWPQMKVSGRPVTVEQAKEIIRRTDSFFTNGYYSNDRDFVKSVCRAVGLPNWAEVNIHEQVDFEKWYNAWEPVTTNYVCNSWVSSSFIFGPNGWCHPDGTIEYVHNIGKWPTVQEVLDDWTKLVTTFPFIELDCVLMSGESLNNDNRPVVGFIVSNGAVEVVAGDDPRLFAVYAEPSDRQGDLHDALSALMEPGFRRECGIPLEWIEEWGNKYNSKE